MKREKNARSPQEHDKMRPESLGAPTGFLHKLYPRNASMHDSVIRREKQQQEERVGKNQVSEFRSK